MSNYRVLFVPALEKSVVETFSHSADSLAEAKAILNAIARYTLQLHERRLMRDYSNTGWVERFVNGEWEEVEDIDNPKRSQQ